MSDSGEDVDDSTSPPPQWKFPVKSTPVSCVGLDSDKNPTLIFEGASFSFSDSYFFGPHSLALFAVNLASVVTSQRVGIKILYAHDCLSGSWDSGIQVAARMVGSPLVLNMSSAEMLFLGDNDHINPSHFTTITGLSPSASELIEEEDSTLGTDSAKNAFAPRNESLHSVNQRELVDSPRSPKNMATTVTEEDDPNFCSLNYISRLLQRVDAEEFGRVVASGLGLAAPLTHDETIRLVVRIATDARSSNDHAPVSTRVRTAAKCAPDFFAADDINMQEPVPGFEETLKGIKVKNRMRILYS